MSVAEPGPPHLPASFCRAISDASSVLDNQYGINGTGSLDSRNQSFSSSAPARASPSMYGPAHPQASHGAVLNSANFRNLSNINGNVPQYVNHQPQIYTVKDYVAIFLLTSMEDLTLYVIIGCLLWRVRIRDGGK